MSSMTIHPMGEHWRAQNRDWNEGYRDGYKGNESQVGKLDQYYTAFDVGRADRIEDDEATASGDLDPMSESEREAIFGCAKDRL